MNWIQNDNQNVDGVQQHPKAYYLFIGDIVFHNVTVLMLFYVWWSC